MDLAGIPLYHCIPVSMYPLNPYILSRLYPISFFKIRQSQHQIEELLE